MDPNLQYQHYPCAGQPYAGQPPCAGQPYAGQPPCAGQPYAGQPYAGQPYAGQPYAAQPCVGQPYMGQPATRTLPPQPYNGPVYAAGASQAARAAPVMHGATVGLDLNHDGRPDLLVQGPDLNQDGIPDALQQVEQQEEEPVSVQMVVPEGAAPGTKLQYTAPDGQELRLTVPDGVPAGSVMTLTQDPVTKQWKCMAEPAEGDPRYEPPPPAPAPAPAQTYGSSVNTYTAPAATYAAPQERVTYVGGISPVVTTYAAGAPTTMLPRTVVAQPMPVNLSYVPPPAVMQHPPMASVGQVITAAPPGSLAADPARFNPPREYPGGEQLYVDQRPSYTPPPVLGAPQPMTRIGDAALLGSTAKVQPQHLPPIIVGQSPSYVPPPVQVMQNSPSYVPPMQPGMMQTAMGFDGQAASIQMPAGMPAPGPSITTLPPQVQPMMAQQPPMGMPPMGQPGMPGPPMMAGMPGVGQVPGLMPMGGLPPLGQMPPFGQMPPPMGPASMGMLGPGGAPPAGTSLVQPGMAPGPVGMPAPHAMHPQHQLMQQQQQQQMCLGGMPGAPPMPGQMSSYQVPGVAPPYPGGMPAMEGMPTGGMPQQAMTMPGMMQPQMAQVGAPQAY